MTVALEGERSKFAAVDKKQRKFDQSLAEEKAISERLAYSFHHATELWHVAFRTEPVSCNVYLLLTYEL